MVNRSLNYFPPHSDNHDVQLTECKDIDAVYHVETNKATRFYKPESISPEAEVYSRRGAFHIDKPKYKK